jgi:D-galactarolactone cycloisomerase
VRITDVTVHLVSVPIPEAERVRSGAGLKLARQAALVEIDTDEGVSGIGPCSFGSASLDLAAVESLVRQVFRPALIGHDPRAIERIWERLYYGIVLRVLGHRGIGVAIQSGIDIALWDLKGRALGVPVYELLGGPMRDAMPAYASSIYWVDPETAAAQAVAYIDEGFAAVKLKVGGNYTTDVACVNAICEALGDRGDLMVDGNMSYSRDLALRFGRQLDDAGVLFFEEPTSIDDVAGHALLADALDTRIATGENLYTRWGFLPFLEADAVDIVQPDCSRTGGISEGRRVCELAAAHHRLAAPHTFSDAYTVAANLYVAASAPNAFIVEVDQTYNPLMTDLVDAAVPVVGGHILLPEEPGLGLELSRDFVADNPYRGELGISPGARPAVGHRGEDLSDRRTMDLGDQHR